MKKFLSVFIICSMLAVLAGCGKTSETEVSKDRLYLYISFDETIADEIDNVTIKYYAYSDGRYLTEKTIEGPIEANKDYDIAVDYALVEGEELYTVEYIVNGDEETKCIRNYMIMPGELFYNHMNYDEDEGAYGTVLAG